MSEARVVLDTNVWVAAGFRRRSASARLVDKIRSGQLRLVWDEATRRETRRILSKIPPLSWDELESLFRDEDRYDGPTAPEQFSYVPDPEDRKFAALSDAAGAPLISMDDDLLAEREKASVPILTPREFLDRHGPSR